MKKPQGATRILIAHFFRRFFDNDTVQADGDTQTTIVRALAIVAVPGMMFAFFLQNLYPRRPMWAAIGDRYFFVQVSFFVLGIVSVFEWDLLFPDRLDFLVLTPLPVRPLQMLSAKAIALAGFLGLFLFGSNFFGVIMLPAFSRGDFFRQVYAQAAAVSLAGLFAALLVIALGGVLLCVADAARFRIASPVLQTVCTMGLVLLLLHGILYGASLGTLLALPLGGARLLPPLWFLGVYEHLLRGSAAPPFAREMARYAIRATLIVLAVVVLTYPLAWRRRSKMAIEGVSGRRGESLRWIAGLVHWVVRRPEERAVFHFIGQTIARNNRYQVYLAMYCGGGLALATVCAVHVYASAGSVHLFVSEQGLRAMIPLLLFWTIVGLRTAFAFPLNISAGWIFRITGADAAACATAARKWVLACGLGVLGCILTVLRVAAFDLRLLLIQAACGVCLSVLLTDAFFSLRQSVPFNRPRMPARTNFPMMLTLYVGIFPIFVPGTVLLEMRIEAHPSRLLIAFIATAAIHAVLTALRRSSKEDEEEMEGYEGEFLLLGLS